MSETLVYTRAAHDRRDAGVRARRQAYEDGFIGLRVVEILELIVPVGMDRRFQVTINATERRLAREETWNLWEQGKLLHQAWPAGTVVLTLADGLDYAGGRQHVMASGSIGQVAKMTAGLNFRVRFPDLPSHSSLYAPQDLEIVL
jgi:hypothetical protein